jgi:hypothetical protein
MYTTDGAFASDVALAKSILPTWNWPDAYNFSPIPSGIPPGK